MWRNLSEDENLAPTTSSTTHNENNTKPATPPTITLKGNEKMTLTVGDKYTEQGATAKDDVDGDITNKKEISGTVNTAK